MDWFYKIINEYTGQDYTPYWLLAGLMFLLVCYTLFRYWVSSSNQRKIFKILKKAGNDILRNLALPDGVDGYVCIDYLLLTPNGIIIVDLKDYSGLIFGGQNTDQWAQVLGMKSYKFENPLYQNQSRVAAVKSLVPGIPVIGWIVFTDAGEFPKGKPDNVYMLNTLLADIGKANKKDEIPELTKLAWQKIRGIIEANKATVAKAN